MTWVAPPHRPQKRSARCQLVTAAAVAAMSRSLSLSWKATSRKSCTSPSVSASTAKIGVPLSIPSSRCRWLSYSTNGLVIRSLLPPTLVVKRDSSSSFSSFRVVGSPQVRHPVRRAAVVVDPIEIAGHGPVEHRPSLNQVDGRLVRLGPGDQRSDLGPTGKSRRVGPRSRSPPGRTRRPPVPAGPGTPRPRPGGRSRAAAGRSPPARPVFQSTTWKSYGPASPAEPGRQADRRS